MVKGINTTTIEKMLVDIYCDKVVFPPSRELKCELFSKRRLTSTP